MQLALKAASHNSARIEDAIAVDTFLKSGYNLRNPGVFTKSKPRWRDTFIQWVSTQYSNNIYMSIHFSVVHTFSCLMKQVNTGMHQ